MTIFLAVTLGFIAGRLFEPILTRIQYHHSWKCPVEGCNSTFRSNVKDALESFKFDHLNHHGL